jgi:glycosyltransferase involved in cell wall biosynthesis
MVTGAYYPEMSSSAIQCREIARVLAGRVRIEVLSTSVDPALRTVDTVDDVKVLRVPVDVTTAVSKVRATAAMIAALVRLLPQADVVHLHGVSTKNVIVTALAKAFRRRILLSLHTAGFDEAPEVRRQGRFAWWAFTRADRYLSVSQGLVDAYLGEGLARNRITLAANGIDVERFAPANADERRALRARLNLPLDRSVILFVGFFSRDKQPRVLFDAWLRLRECGSDATLVFVGATESTYFEVDQDLAQTIREDAVKRGLDGDVVLAGPRHDVEQYFRAADVFVLPSRREGLPVALLEAMACGLPCVASQLAGSTDTIIDDGKNGLLVPAGDFAAVSGAIGQLLRDPALGSSLGAEARQTVVRRFSNTGTADLWLNAYQQLAAGQV